MSQSILRNFIVETIFESNNTQSKRLQALTNTITTDIMRLIHRKKTKLSVTSITREDYLSFDPKTQTDEFYELIAGPMPLSMDWDSYEKESENEIEDSTIFVTVEIDRNASQLNVSGEDKDPTGTGRLGFIISAELTPNILPQQYSQIRNQVANSVRHEVEHLTQGKASDQEFLAYGRGEDYFTFLHSPDEVKSSYGKYLLKPEEIPAFVRGETHNAKNVSELKNNIENFLNGYISQGLIKVEEKLVIMDTWLDWAKRHIHRKGF